MEKIIDIIDSIAYEKGLKISDVEEALKDSLIKTAQKMVDETLVYEATINRANKELKLAQKVEVLANDDKRLYDGATDEDGNLINTENYISIDEAKEIDQSLEIGDTLSYDLEFESMGRNAATILFSSLEYKLQRFIEDNLYNKYNEQVGDTVSSVVTRIDANDNTYIEIGEIKGILPRKNRIKGESFKVGDALKAVIRKVTIDKKHGLIIEVSRTSPKFLESLLTSEVPELKDEKIKIEGCARIPGSRAKIALSTTSSNIDPIGAVVGVKGVRINAVSKQLKGESIDCIEYTPIKEMFVSRSLSPANVKSVKIEAGAGENGRDKAIVTIEESEKSKAIGKVGLNIRLASMLTQCDIELNILGGSTTQIPKDAVDTSEEKSTDISNLEALFK
ncbi:MAG: transcription termination/antitermination protein NusA [Campylobacterales bacterium]|nr:transcription termination/antitermination protein NusA [Campylobacterales bacterium]